MRTATLKSRLPLIIGELKPTMLEGVKDVAEAIADGARDRVPVDSGDLQAAIHVVEEEGGGGVSVVAGDDAVFYGHIVEHGGVHTGAQPFMIPALEAERPRLSDIVGDKLQDL